MNQSQPRLTIITPNFNGARYLERAICSVLDQGYEALEYILIDGGSTDGSLEIIRTYQDDLAHFATRPDSGPAEAINQALEHATGEYVAVLDADDLLLPGALHAVASRIARDQPDWLVGQGVRIGPLDQKVGDVTATAPGSLAGYLMHNSGLLPSAATFYRRTLLEQHGRFDADLACAYAYELSCRLLAADVQPTLMDQRIVAVREHSQSRSASRIIQQGMEHVDAAQRHGEALATAPRYALWRNCDQRRRIYALAEAECAQDRSRRFRWQQLLRRPWWLASEHYRQSLLRNATSADASRRAA